jgi:hypothetical protein
MQMKSVFITAAFALATLSIASAKSYDITLGVPAMAGNTELKAGQYKLKVDGNQAVFTNAEDAKSFTTPVRIENSDRKFDQTAIQSRNQNGTDSIREIDLGGSTTKLEFGQ